jgi:hypothetical protein
MQHTPKGEQAGADRPSDPCCACLSLRFHATSICDGALRVARRGLTLEGRWLYVDRMQSYRPPLADARFHAIDRTLQLEARWEAQPRLLVRLGGLYDKIGVSKSGDTGRFGYGTRKESRAYVGLVARFGRVRVSGVEGIELDREPYEVWHHHDKGFLQLQTTF